MHINNCTYNSQLLIPSIALVYLLYIFYGFEVHTRFSYLVASILGNEAYHIRRLSLLYL